MCAVEVARIEAEENVRDGHPWRLRSLQMTAITRGGARRGRGATFNPVGRFEMRTNEVLDDGWSEPDVVPRQVPTVVVEQQARSIISRNDSPDVPFTQSVNPYQGCEHGCVYCYARPSHAYLNLSPGIDFETRIFAKGNAADRLRDELAAPAYRCTPIALGANTDPYQPVERHYRLTRAVLEVLADCRHPFTITTKGALVERDLDLIAPAAAQGLARVFVSVPQLDHRLARRLEPRASAPARRIESIRRLAAAGVPTGVLVAPVIPFVNDSELEAVLAAARAAGATMAAFIVLRLPHEVRGLFSAWLQDHQPLKRERVLAALREMHGGRDNDPRFGSRMTGSGHFAQLIARRFELASRRLGFAGAQAELRADLFRSPRRDRQLELF